MYQHVYIAHACDLFICIIKYFEITVVSFCNIRLWMNVAIY